MIGLSASLQNRPTYSDSGSWNRAFGIERIDEIDVHSSTDSEVVFTVGRRLMHDPSAVFDRDVAVFEYNKCVRLRPSSRGRAARIESRRDLRRRLDRRSGSSCLRSQQGPRPPPTFRALSRVFCRSSRVALLRRHDDRHSRDLRRRRIRPSGPTQSARFSGSVQGVVVQAVIKSDLPTGKFGRDLVGAFGYTEADGDRWILNVFVVLICLESLRAASPACSCTA